MKFFLKLKLFSNHTKTNIINNMNINDFINKWLRPEVKFLILQYTVSSPIKSELKKFLNKRKYIKYKWVRYEYSWRMRTPTPTYCLYIHNSNSKRRGIDLLEEEPNGAVYVSNTKLLINN